jgi:hypothetical protein
MLWAVVSTPFLKDMQGKGFGTFFLASMSGKLIRFVGYSFVDGTDLIQTAQSPSNSEQQVGQRKCSAPRTHGRALSAPPVAQLSPSRASGTWLGLGGLAEGRWAYKNELEVPATLLVRKTVMDL